jgi:hypothetical protein
MRGPQTQTPTVSQCCHRSRYLQVPGWSNGGAGNHADDMEASPESAWAITQLCDPISGSDGWN